MAKYEYGVELKNLDEVNGVDCVVVAVAHKEFRELGLEGIEKLYREDTEKVLIDVKGIYQIEDLKHSGLVCWRL